MAVITLVDRSHSRWTQVADRSCRPFSLRPALRERGPRSVSVPGIGRNLQVKMASTSAERREAFQLVADQYQARGYEAAACDFRFTSYHALPDTVTLVAKEGERVRATLSLVMDNNLLGLPMETIYDAEIKELRRAGRRLCEVTSLADTGLTTREFIAIFVSLIRVAWQYVVGEGGDTAVISVNPRHSAFYTKVLGFVPLAGRRAYPSVRNAPAEAFFLDPPIMQKKAPAMHERIFGEPLSAAVLTAPEMATSLIRFFARNSSQTDPRLVDEILQYVATCGSPRRW